MANHFSILALRTPWTVWKRQKDRTLKCELPREVGNQYGTREEYRNNPRKNQEMEPKWRRCPVVDVTGDGRKARCCKEQCCIGTWNIRSMNQGKLEVARQEMARVNIDSLEIRALKWRGMGEFNSDDHYIYNCGQKSLRRHTVHYSQQKSLKCSTWILSQKWKNDVCLLSRQTIQYHSNPSLCPDH